MKILHNKKVISFLLCLIFINISFNLFYSKENSVGESQLDPKQSSFWNLTCTIEIDDDDPGKNWFITVATQPWCSGSGSFSDPFIIENISLNALGADRAILIEDSNAYFIIRNSTIFNYHIGGIYLKDTNNGFLFNNSVYTGNGDGIYIQDSSNNTVSRNTVYDNGYSGVKIDCNYYNSNYNRILNNTIYDNTEAGIYLDGSYNEHILDVNHNLISDNDISFNKYGVYSTFADYTNYTKNNVLNNSLIGMYVRNGDYQQISNNLVANNTEEGIRILSVDHCTLNGNFLTKNDYGIRLYSHNDYCYVNENNLSENNLYGLVLGDNDVNDNTIYNNSFSNNPINALDDGTNTQWSVGSLGNYWNDYTGTDANDDGIGDTPYDVPPAGGSVDNYPIWEDGDDIGPQITVLSPVNYTLFDSQSPTFELSIQELYLSSSWYYVNDTFYEFFTGESGKVNQTQWDLFPDGDVKLTFWVNDSQARVNFSSVIVTKHTTAPTITILSPSPDDILGYQTPDFIVQVIDFSLDRMWYTINNSEPHYFSANSSFDENLWKSFGNGTLSLTFYANDTNGLLNSVGINVVKNLTAPLMFLQYPLIDQTFGFNPPYFILEVLSDCIDVMWYTINNSAPYFFSVNSSFDENLWESFGNGTLSVTFYANDTYAYLSSFAVVINKDLTPPSFLIQYPEESDIIGENAVAYELICFGDWETTWDKVWYSLNNGPKQFITFHPINGYSGTLNQSLWDILPNGNVTITFYVNTTTGNTAFRSVVVIKYIPPPNDIPSIAGYEIELIIGLMVLSMFMLILKKNKRKVKQTAVVL